MNEQIFVRSVYKIKGNEIGTAGSTHREKEKCLLSYVEKHERKRSFRKPRLILEDNIKIHLKRIE
jgi:hypothetical protein